MAEGGWRQPRKVVPHTTRLSANFFFITVCISMARHTAHHPLGPKPTRKAEILSLSCRYRLGARNPCQSKQASSLCRSWLRAARQHARFDVYIETWCFHQDHSLSLGGFCDGCADQLFNKRPGHALPDIWKSMFLAHIQTNPSKFVPNFPSLANPRQTPGNGARSAAHAA